MGILSSISAVLRVLVVFSIIVALIRRKLSLGHIFLIASLVLSGLFLMPPLATLGSVAHSVTEPKTLSLALVVSLILVLSSSMEVGGAMESMLRSFKGLIKNGKLNIIIFPALIGLLPMPGGAVFSAPMVKDLGRGSSYGPARLSFINYWFRHIWEYWWPLYPGVLLATLMADLSLPRFILVTFPLTVFVLWMGSFSLSRVSENEDSQNSGRSIGPFIRELSPIIIVIVFGLGLGILLSNRFPELLVSKELGLLIALAASIGYVWKTSALSKKQIRSILLNTGMLKMVYMVFTILIFKGILEDSRAVVFIAEEMMRTAIPLVLIVAVLPLIVGLVTGITIGFVGGTLPILIPLIHAMDPGGWMYAYMMLALVCGFSGVMLSPVHLCFILSNEYFKTDTASVYRQLWIPCVGLFFGGLIYFYILSYFMQ